MERRWWGNTELQFFVWITALLIGCSFQHDSIQLLSQQISHKLASFFLTNHKSPAAIVPCIRLAPLNTSLYKLICQSSRIVILEITTTSRCNNKERCQYLEKFFVISSLTFLSRWFNGGLFWIFWQLLCFLCVINSVSLPSGRHGQGFTTSSCVVSAQYCRV